MSPFYFKCMIFCNESKRNKKLVLAWLAFSSQWPLDITQSDGPAVLGGSNADRADCNPDRDVCVYVSALLCVRAAKSTQVKM
jgi:hypothetical protein